MKGISAMKKKYSPHDLIHTLKYLNLPYMAENHQELAQMADKKQWSHLDYLDNLAKGEADFKNDRSTQRRIHAARLPSIKTLDQFDWAWPKKINRLQIQNIFRLQSINDKSNVIFIGGVGVGKTHLASALAYSTCLNGSSVLFASAIDIVNTLSASQNSGRMKQELKKYLKPDLLLIDELGFLPVDKKGADLLFQVISMRYENNSTVITTNRPYKEWPGIFNNDSTLTSAILDRLLHHAETVIIEGPSYRMKDNVEK
jgi:DNA replication protein DnaC